VKYEPIQTLKEGLEHGINISEKQDLKVHDSDLYLDIIYNNF
jgi:hypothetical protein